MTTNCITTPNDLQPVLDTLSNNGCEIYLVGGAVIDSLKGKEIKDWDIEVFGISINNLHDILKQFGNPKEVGKEFGIIKMTLGEIEYDFSVPRKENRVGFGHKDFQIELCPDITIKEAARRRDLTINSISFDLVNSRYIDPFNGISDLDKGIIRHIDKDTFIEDPLRVLRIMQILARKGKVVDPETIELCKSIKDTFQYLTKERVFEEFVKLLMKSDKPSMGLQFLIDCEWIDHFPTLKDLIDCKQNEKHHPEGDVWNHTCMVIDLAAKYRNEIPEEWRMAFMFGMLLHDCGKPLTTDNETLTSYSHDMVGGKVFMNFMDQITNRIDLINKTKSIIVNHMRPGQLKKCGAKVLAWRKLHNKLPLEIAKWVSICDNNGRTRDDKKDSSFMNEEIEMMKKPEIAKAIVTGKDLIAIGMKPGKDFKRLLEKGFDFQVANGVSDKETIMNHIVEGE